MRGIDDCLRQIMAIPGARSVTLADGASGLAVASAGHGELVDEHADAAQTTDVVRAVIGCPALRTTHSGDDVQEIIVAGSQGWHLITLVDGDYAGRLFLHLLIDREKGNLALARHRLTELIAEMAGGGA